MLTCKWLLWKQGRDPYPFCYTCAYEAAEYTWYLYTRSSFFKWKWYMRTKNRTNLDYSFSWMTHCYFAWILFGYIVICQCCSIWDLNNQVLTSDFVIKPINSCSVERQHSRSQAVQETSVVYWSWFLDTGWLMRGSTLMELVPVIRNWMWRLASSWLQWPWNGRVQDPGTREQG